MSGESAAYSPLYAEKRCAVCGQWRGQHNGASADNSEMRCARCPDFLVKYYGTTPSFVPAD